MVADVLPKEMQLELQRELAALVHQSHQELAALVRGTLREAVQEELGARGRSSSDQRLLDELRSIVGEQRRAAHGKLGLLTPKEEPSGSLSLERRPKSAPEDLRVLGQEPRRSPRQKQVTIMTDSHQASSSSEGEKGARVVIPGIIVPPVECRASLPRGSAQGAPAQCCELLTESSSEDEDAAGRPEHGGLGLSSGHPRLADIGSPSSSYPSTPRVRGTVGGEQPGNHAAEESPRKLGMDRLSTLRLSWFPPLMTAASNAVRSFGRPSEQRRPSEVHSPARSPRGRGCLVWQEETAEASTRADWTGSQPGSLSASAPPSEPSNFSARPDTAEDTRCRALQRDSPGPRISRISIVHGLKRRSTEWRHVVTYESAFVLLRSNVFDYLICAVLFLNAMSIGLQVDHAARHLGEAQPEIFKHLEVMFCFIFLGEILLRLYVYRSRFFKLPHGRWNYLDLGVVIVQVFEVIMMWIFGESNVTLPNLRLLRFLRLIRILRLLRLINVIQELNKLVYLILGSLWSFLWTTALLMLMTLVGGVFFTQLVADHLNGPPGTGLSPSDQELQKIYGSLGDTILSLLAATSGGVDWMDVLRPLMESMPAISFLLALLFIVYIAFAVLVVMNLVTGVFVDGAKRLTNLENEKDLLKKVQRAFVLTDLDNSSVISWPEFRMQLDSPFMKDFFNCVDIEPTQAATLFSLLDNDNTFTLSAEEFVQGTLRLRGPAKAFDLAALQHENRVQSQGIRERITNLEDALGQIASHLGVDEAGSAQGGPLKKKRQASAPPCLRRQG